MFDTGTLLVLVPALPLAAAVITAALGPRVLRGRSHVPTVVAIGLAALVSLVILVRVHRPGEHAAHGASAEQQVGHAETITLWTWASVDAAYDQPAGAGGSSLLPAQRPSSVARDFRIELTLRADALSAVMLVTVTLVSFLVAVYSIGYMHGDPGYWRFFSYIGLFVFSMTMLVSVSNFLLLYVFWEAVGLCSYLLIGFWYQKPEAAAAGKKAFLVNRVGDFGFALAVFLIWVAYGTLNFHDTGAVTGVLGQARLDGSAGFVGGATGTAICLLLMLGACGKSAQFPLHVWLPDAMEGPTPVSALIHAATMVTAGVYMVTRCAPLFLASTSAQLVVAVIGGFTALLGALIALTQTDLKRILAYSTISQLGYMFLALGTGSLLGITAGMFHLFTHAFFKALLFLGAGSVMHATGGVIDICRFGGLRRVMPWTYATFLIGCLALAGVFPFAGFWSKDLILAAVQHEAVSGSYGSLYLLLYWMATATALLTAFYTFRALFLAFHGELQLPEESGGHVHESPGTMLIPLVLLAAGALLAGVVFEPTHWFAGYLAQAPSVQYVARAAHRAAQGQGHWFIALVSTVAALAGVAFAAVMYLPRQRRLRERVSDVARRTGLYGLSFGKFFFDEIYFLCVVLPIWLVAEISFWFDRQVIDRLVNFVGRIPLAVGASLRGFQSGLVQNYALLMVLSLLVLLALMLI